MPREPSTSPYRKRPLTKLRAVRADMAGSTAVEFAFVGMILVTMILGIFQFALVFMAQMYLHDAVAEAATGKTTATYAGNRAGVVTQICERMFIVDGCTSKLALETQPLSSYSTSPQPIDGTIFVAATVGTPMLMRAKAPVVTFVPLLPQLNVSATALYARRSS